MSLFPTTITPGLPSIKSIWNTTITPMKSGKENRTQNWVFNRRIVTVTFPNISLLDAKSIINFYNNDCKGARYSFHFKWTVSENYTKEYIDQGDGTTTTFTLPLTGGADGTTTMYEDDVEQAARTFSAAGGTDSRDQVVFDSAPADGELITASFTGYWTPEVRFPDNIAYQYNLHDIMTYEKIELIEVRT